MKSEEYFDLNMLDFGDSAPEDTFPFLSAIRPAACDTKISQFYDVTSMDIGDLQNHTSFFHTTSLPKNTQYCSSTHDVTMDELRDVGYNTSPTSQSSFFNEGQTTQTNGATTSRRSVDEPLPDDDWYNLNTSTSIIQSHDPDNGQVARVTNMCQMSNIGHMTHVSSHQNTDNKAANTWFELNTNPLQIDQSDIPNICQAASTDQRNRTLADDVIGDLNLDETLKKATMEAVSTGTIMPIIKEEIKSSIQSRRLATGKQELVVPNFTPSTEQLSEDDLLKRRDRRERNKTAAQKCRQRKKQSLDNLTQEASNLEEQNRIASTDIDSLRQELSHLRSIFQHHVCVRQPNR